MEYYIQLNAISGFSRQAGKVAEAGIASKDEFFAQFQKLTKKKKLETKAQQEAFMSGFDWMRMTEQDEQVWDTILAHLEDRK